jgi:hypothetical protein
MDEAFDVMGYAFDGSKIGNVARLHSRSLDAEFW